MAARGRRGGLLLRANDPKRIVEGRSLWNFAGSLVAFNFAGEYVSNPESGSDHRMLPIRWILPVVGALFALALLPLAFSPRDTSRSLSNSVVMSNERPERRQTLVPLGIQRKELESRGLDAPAIDAVASLSAADEVTGSIDATTPVAAKPALKPTIRRTSHVRRPVYRRAKYARSFTGQRAWHLPKQEFKFNAN
jgi:hypothetical protein